MARSAIKTILDILQSLADYSNLNITNLGNRANLSHGQTRKRLVILMQNGLIKSEQPYFILTPQGFDALKTITQYQETLSKIGIL